MTCTATTTATRDGVEEVVTCKKDARHVEDEVTENHWGVTSYGMDVVWAETVLRPPAARGEG